MSAASKKNRRRAPRRETAAAPPAEPRQRRPRLERPAVLGGLVFFVLFGAYMASGDFLPGRDAVPNARLAPKLLAHHRLTFTPEQDPFMFDWKLITEQGEKWAQFRSWDDEVGGYSMRRLRREGLAREPRPAYYLMATRFRDVYVGKYGPATGLYALPFFAAVYPFFGASLYDNAAAVWYTSKAAAAAAVAGSAVLLLLAGLPYLRRFTAVSLALAYGLGTCVWSTSSQALWQHGPAGLFLALGTFFLLRTGQPRAALLAGASFAMAFASRPTAAVAVVAAGIYLLVVDRRQLVRYALGGLPVALLLGGYNWHYFRKLLVFGQMNLSRIPRTATGSAAAGAGLDQLGGGGVDTVARLGQDAWAGVSGPLHAGVGSVFTSDLASATAGVLVSPSRGLLVFSPIAIFALWGAVRIWRDARFTALRPMALAALGMALVAAKWVGWWGGWAYGYRLLLEPVVLLAFVAIPVAEEIRGRRVLAVVFGLFLTWSVGVQVLGVLAYDVIGWNHRVMYAIARSDKEQIRFLDRARAEAAGLRHGVPVEEIRADVDRGRHSGRLWSWRDSQILYYVTHFSESRLTRKRAIAEFLAKLG